MSIVRVKIKRYKSIKNCDAVISKENLLVGENGSGKSNFISAIKYFYSNLLKNNKREDVFDENNKYSNEVVISIYYDIREINKVVQINRDKYPSYHKKLDSIYKRSNKGILMVEMRQIKNMSINWNLEYSDRQIIKNIYNVYDLNSRGTKDDKWGLIWKLLGDYFKGYEATHKVFKEKLHKGLVEDEELKELNKKHKTIKEIFEKEDIKIKEWTNKEYFSKLLKMLFSGDEFIKNNRKLDYFSEGTDTFNYYSIATSIISQISINKMKRPIIFLDEPETNLHHKYIDKFTDILNLTSDKLTFVISTHSSRLIKNAIRTDLINNTIHVTKNTENYSCYKKINLNRNREIRHKYQLSDEDANAYFSKYIILVEGETELELFNNLVIRRIFSEIKDIDFYMGSTGGPVKDIIIPNKTKADTSFYSVLDIDQVIIYEKEKNNLQFKLKLEERRLFNKINHKDENYFINRNNSDEKYRDSIYFHYKNIKKRVVKRNSYIDTLVDLDFILKYEYDEFVDYIFKGKKILYKEDKIIKGMIYEYLSKYNIYFIDTTIEGTIINDKTINYIKEYIFYYKIDDIYKKSKITDDYKKKIEYNIDMYKRDVIEILDKYPINIQIEMLRIAFKGKSSNLMKLQSIEKYLNEIYNYDFKSKNNEGESENSNIKKIKGYCSNLKNDLIKLKKTINFKDKTSWVSEFFMYYYFRKLYYNKTLYIEEIVGLYKGIDIIFKYYKGEIKLTENRLKNIKNNFDIYFKNYEKLQSEIKNSINFSSNTNKNLKNMKNEFPEIMNLIDLLM